MLGRADFEGLWRFFTLDVQYESGTRLNNRTCVNGRIRSNRPKPSRKPGESCRIPKSLCQKWFALGPEDVMGGDRAKAEH